MQDNNSPPDEAWISRWNDRYKESTYAYGEEPNEFFKSRLAPLTPGRILLPAEGEGRNAVYAARLGWEVTAFDISVEGRKKALTLAERHQVQIQYHVGMLEALSLDNSFDVLALIFAHFPATYKSQYHQQLGGYLKPGGHVILEAFSKSNLELVQKDERIGGPRDLASLFSVDEIRSDFPDYRINQLEELEVDLQEGQYHQGRGAVVRFYGQKPA